MTTIAVDLDSTLYDFETPFRQACIDLAQDREDKERYFKLAYHSWVQWRSPTDIHNDIFVEALEIVHSDEVIRSRQPFEQAPEVIQELWDEGHALVYITNRDPSCQEATEDWIHEHFAPGDVVCTNDLKAAYVSECRYLIDDRPRTMIDFIYDREWEPGQRKAFSKMYPYNDSLTDIPNIYLAPTWSGIRYYLERKGVLNGRSASLTI